MFQSSEPLRREMFLRESERSAFGSCQEGIRALLLAQDGSTTTLLESTVRAKVSVRILAQEVVDQLPMELDGELPGGQFLRRIMSLHAGGEVLLDSMSYTAIDVLPRSVIQELLEGVQPISHALFHLWTKRKFRERDVTMFKELWDVVGHPDPQSSRSMCIYTPRAPCILLAETFRRGALVQSKG